MNRNPSVDTPKEEQNKRYPEKVRELLDDGFYGKIVLSAEGGRIVFLRKEETIKL